MSEQTAENSTNIPVEDEAVLEINHLRVRIAELEAELLRQRAEAENQRKRAAREFDQARKFGVERLLGDLLPVLDSLEQGLKLSEGQQANVESLRQGSEMTLKLLHKAAESHGLTALDPQGQHFNPDEHQAMSVVARADVPENQVVMVLQKGYRLHERLLRPALVMVSKTPEAA